MSKTKAKTFDPDEFLFDLYAMSSTEVVTLFREEIRSRVPHIEKIEVMIESGIVDLDAIDKDGRTPLHRACGNNALELAKLLIARGADGDAKDNWGWTPLHWACRNNAHELAKLLLEKGAEVGAKNKWGETPLDVAGSDEMGALLKQYMK